MAYAPRVLDTILHSLTALLEPIGLLWLALLLTMLAALRKRKFGTAVYAGLAAAFMFAVGATRLPETLLSTLERPYLITNLDAVPTSDAVVILGGGMRPSKYEVAEVGLNEAADRFIMGVELMRRGKADNLVLGGATRTFNGHKINEPELVHRWFTKWGLVDAPIFDLPDCLNTHDEALRTADLLKAHGWRRVLLVTSAAHMRRAAGVFKTAGVLVFCVACDYQTRVSVVADDKINFIPQASGFNQMSIYLHEEIGWLTYQWRGWIKN